MPGTVRDAGVADPPVIRALAAAAWRDTYAGLLLPGTIEAFIEAAYSVDALERRIANDSFLIVENDGVIIAFADAIALPDRLNLAAIQVHPDQRGHGAGTLLLAGLRTRFSKLPIAADVLAGNRKGEVFYERRGFIPSEILEDELFGEHVAERRWWLGPAATTGADEP